MSISSAFSHAASGLAAASRSAQLVASNIANAATEGYAPRSLSVSSGFGGGVRVEGIARQVSPMILADRRIAEAAQRQSLDLATGLEKIEGLVGTPLDGTSLSSMLTEFESALIQAGSRPESSQRLMQVSIAAAALVDKFRSVSDGLQSLRSRADRDIAGLVDQVNTDLERLQQLNRNITLFRAQGSDVASLQDERQLTIDRIARIIPVNEIPRENGAVAIFTMGGAILLDGTASQIFFSPVNIVAPQMTQANGLLSGLSLSGVTVSTDPSFGPFRGGALEAAFRVRDDSTVTVQGLIDGLARDLVERFSASSLDPSAHTGQPGLFTDAGQALDPNGFVGLAGRLALNPSVDPRQGGLPERLRDGLTALPSGPSGDGTLLSRMIASIEEPRTPGSGFLPTGERSFPALLAEAMSQISASRQYAEQTQTFASSRASALKMAELEAGVDTDNELQTLMRIEQAFAANAKVIQAIDDMITNLLRI
jgi:flagellar hook-associated protein 1